MSELTQVIIIVAALVYLGNQLSTMIADTLDRTIRQRIKELNSLHDTAEREIESSFELWWHDGPKQKVHDEVITKMAASLPGEIPRDRLEQMVGPMIPIMLHGIEGMALHLAIHAHLGDKEQQLIAKLPKIGNLREKIAKGRALHEKDLDSIRVDMLDHGINPAELEAHFAQTP